MKTLEELWTAHKELLDEAKAAVRKLVADHNICRLDLLSYYREYELYPPEIEVYLGKYGNGASLIPVSLVVWDDCNLSLRLSDDETYADYGSKDLDEIGEIRPVLGLLDTLQEILSLIDSGQAPLLTGEDPSAETEQP